MDMNIQGLDQDAWDRWVAYRKAIRKPLKEISLHAAALKLSKYGADQAEVVNQSISNQWQGLFELRKGKLQPGEKPEKTDKQKAADEARFEHQTSDNIRMWEEIVETTIGRLRLADAYLARLNMNRGSIDYAEKRDFLKHHVGDLIRKSEPKKVYGDIHIVGLVRELFGDIGVRRLKERAIA